MKGMSECAVLTIALAVVAQPVIARTYLNCSTKKVVIISAPTENTSSSRVEDLGFWVDDAAKLLTFVDNTALTVSRLDRAWMVAERAEHGPGPIRLLANLITYHALLEYAQSPTKVSDGKKPAVPATPKPTEP